jgi:acyl carrier protein phosphodiesterase
MKYNQTTLDKLETILEESGYIVRYERGTFQSGYCILEQKKVVVLNKFLQLEGRINTMLDLIPQLNVSFDALTAESQKLYEDVMAKAAVKETEK